MKIIESGLLKVLANVLDLEDMEAEIDKLSRINSQIYQNEWGYFGAFYQKADEIKLYWQHFNTRLKMENLDIIVLKEIPIRILFK